MQRIAMANYDQSPVIMCEEKKDDLLMTVKTNTDQQIE
jgi:hypothetical protein